MSKLHETGQIEIGAKLTKLIKKDIDDGKKTAVDAAVHKALNQVEQEVKLEIKKPGKVMNPGKVMSSLICFVSGD